MINRSKTINILSYIYLSGIIIAMIVYGPLPIFYLAFVVLAGFFILPNRAYLGLGLLIALTMIFERYFTLQGLVLEDTTYKFYLLDAVMLFSALALVWSYKIKQKELKLIWGWPEKILVIWLILMAAYLVRSFFDINAKFEIAFSSFKNYFFYALLYLLIIYIVNSGKKLKNIVHLILLVATGLIGFIFIGFIRGNGLWTEFTPLSTVGTRYLAGTHAFYLALAAMIGVTLLLYKRLSSTSLSLMIMSFWAVGIGVSLMRHLWMAVAIGLVIIFTIIDRQHKKIFSTYAVKIGLGIISLIAIILLVTNLMYFSGSVEKINTNIQALTQRATSVLDLSADSSATWRQDTWSQAKNEWLKNPIYGIGFGHEVLIDTGDWQNFEEIRNIHNSPLAILVQAGIIGLILFGVFILSVLFEIRNKAFQNQDLKPYYLGLIAALSVFLFSSIFQPYLETNLMGIWFWVILGLLRTASLIKYENSTNQ